MNTYRLTTGDLSQTNLLRGSQSRLKAELARLSDELTTGRRSTLHPSLGGDLSPLASLQRSRAAIAPWQGVANEARIAADAIQLALGQISTSAQSFATTAIGVAGMGSADDVSRASSEAASLFGQVVSMLNGTAAGRSLFAGVSTDGPALLPADDILAQVAAATAGAVSAADYAAAVDTYFGPGGGFETGASLAGDAPSLRIGPTETLGGLPTVEDPALRDTLAALALAAIAGDPSLAIPASLQVDIMTDAGTRLLSAGGDVIDLQASLGYVQERIEAAQTRLDHEAGALDLAISDLTVADPYDTAAQLEATQIQLDTLFAVTARLSSMGLAGYLR